MSAPTAEHGSVNPDGKDFVARINPDTHDVDPALTSNDRAAQIQELNSIPTQADTEFTEGKNGQLEMFQLPESPTDEQNERVRATAKLGYEATNRIVSGAERMKRVADRLNDATDRWNNRKTLGERFDQTMSADGGDKALDRITGTVDKVESGVSKTAAFFSRIARGALNQAREIGTSIKEEVSDLKAENAKRSAQKKEAALARKAERIQARNADRLEKEAYADNARYDRDEDEAYSENAHFDKQADKAARKEARAEAREEKKAEKAAAKESARAERQERIQKTRTERQTLKDEAQARYDEYHARNRAYRKERREMIKDGVVERADALKTRAFSIGRVALSPLVFVGSSIRENYADHRVELSKNRANKLQNKVEKARTKADKAQTKYAEKAYANNRY